MSIRACLFWVLEHYEEKDEIDKVLVFWNKSELISHLDNHIWKAINLRNRLDKEPTLADVIPLKRLSSVKDSQ